MSEMEKYARDRRRSLTVARVIAVILMLPWLILLGSCLGWTLKHSGGG